MYGSWDQSALQYNAAEGDSLVPQVAPDPITRSDPNDENYYFERWAGAVAPSIWKYPDPPMSLCRSASLMNSRVPGWLPRLA